MSINSVPDIVRQGWGLEEEDLDRIIKIERLKDVSQGFSGQIKSIVEVFGGKSRIRVIAFDEQSGIDRNSRAIFEAFISGEREVFYIGPLSNRECCVVLVHNPRGISTLRSYKHILPHEYAHHAQFAHEGFPFLVARGVDEEKWIPDFVKPYKVGPETGSAYIDDLLLPSLAVVIQDSNERLSDVVCEGLLREKSLICDFFQYYNGEVALRRDPAATLPSWIRSPSLRDYVRRLALRDMAEWGATVQLAYPEYDEAKKIISKGRAFSVKLNEKKFQRASQAYDGIFNLCINTDFRSFLIPDDVISYTKKVMASLNIEIKTSETW